MSSSQSQQAPPSGPPYAPRNAQLGGYPTTTVDVPISAVLIALFISAAALNMTIFQVNKRRGHKFVLSGVTFGFCMARIVANVLRIVWACYPDNVRIMIAASIFFNAGVLILFVVNLIFLQRILRARHPIVGWSKALRWVFIFLYFGVFACLVMVVTAVVYSFHTLDMGVLSKLNDVRRVAAVYMAILAFIPLPGTIICMLIPRRGPVDNFGTGSMRTKVLLVIFTSALLTLGAGFRAGVGFAPRLPSNPGWFNHKAAYYCFQYVIELIVVFTYALNRFDRRFHVPNGSNEPGDYSRGALEKGNVSGDRISTDETLTGADEMLPITEEERRREQAWETQIRQEKRAQQVV